MPELSVAWGDVEAVTGLTCAMGAEEALVGATHALVFPSKGVIRSMSDLGEQRTHPPKRAMMMTKPKIMEIIHNIVCIEPLKDLTEPVLMTIRLMS